MLSGRGFENVYNLSGGIKALKEGTAYGPEDSGITMFDLNAGAEEAIIVGFGLEVGLRDFYLAMESKMVDPRAKELFAMLAEVEVIHQKQLAELYGEVVGRVVGVEEFRDKLVKPAMEGGLSTTEYLDRYQVDTGSDIEILSLAMAIEVQALDLYLRAAAGTTVSQTKEVLMRIADEERNHIAKLSHYIDHREAPV